MKNILILLLLCMFASCNSSGDGAVGGECSNTKGIFSVWTSEDDSIEIDIRDATWDDLIQVTFGEGACDQTRGDYLLRISENGQIDFRNCGHTFSTDTANWDIRCNKLHVKYYSDGREEVYK